MAKAKIHSLIVKSFENKSTQFEYPEAAHVPASVTFDQNKNLDLEGSKKKVPVGITIGYHVYASVESFNKGGDNVGNYPVRVILPDAEFAQLLTTVNDLSLKAKDND